MHKEIPTESNAQGRSYCHWAMTPHRASSGCRLPGLYFPKQPSFENNAMSTKHDVNTVKIAAMGHWPEILNQLTYIPMTSLDGEHHPCPICAGTDRFNVDRNKFAETGSCHCNQQCGLSGDGFHVLRTINGWDFPTAIHEVAGCSETMP